MKIGIVLDTKLHSGGGFQQSLNAIVQLRRICPEWLSIEVFTDAAANARHPSLAGIPVRLVGGGLGSRLRRALFVPAALDLFLARCKIATALERAMRARGVDMVYFTSPSPYALALRSLPYIFTVWDLCHRDHPEFPEVSANGEFSWRENFYRNAINRSYLTLTDSEDLNHRIVDRYGTDRNRLVTMPFQPAGFVIDAAGDGVTDVAMRLALPSDYLFYPAQFWPHKNHVRILEALAKLKLAGRCYPAVFCGGEPRSSNKGHIQSMAEKLGVADQVVFLGFVEEQEMRALYFLARALVMPTYFGPTNLPPIEAWALKKPVIYSTPYVAQTGDAALCVNPDSVSELAEAIEQVYRDECLVQTLIKRGEQRIKEVEAMSVKAEAQFLTKLEVFKTRTSCWK
jgi:glycosyltransferase involved in cell wall biosynthesis